MSNEKKNDVHTTDSEKHVLKDLITKLHDSKFLDDVDYKNDLKQIDDKKD